MCHPAASLLSPGVRVTVSPHEAVKNCVLVSHGLCILGHKHHRLSELDVLGDHVSCESPLSWGPRCGIRTFVPQGRAGSLSSLPAVCYHHRGRLMVTLCLSPSYCFHVGFLICLLWRSHATHFWISFSFIIQFFYSVFFICLLHNFILRWLRDKIFSEFFA